MEKINVKTGINLVQSDTEPSEKDDNIKTFILVFMAIIWRRVWLTAAIYCEHNKLKLSNDIVVVSLKYNIYSNAGIGNVLKPYINKALVDGFLMPKIFKKNIYATRAVKLYKTAYNIIMSKNNKVELLFLKEYALSIFKMDRKSVKDVVEETRDTVNIVDNKDKNKRYKNFISDYTSEYTEHTTEYTSDVDEYSTEYSCGSDTESPISDRKNNLSTNLIFSEEILLNNRIRKRKQTQRIRCKYIRFHLLLEVQQEPYFSPGII